MPLRSITILAVAIAFSKACVMDFGTPPHENEGIKVRGNALSLLDHSCEAKVTTFLGS